jgi:hypothetical protein
MIDPYDINIEVQEGKREGGEKVFESDDLVFSPEKKGYGDDDDHSSMWRTGNK